MEQGLEIFMLGAYFNPVHSNKELVRTNVEYFKEHLKYANELNCRYVGTETGSYNDDKWTYHPQNRTEEALQTVVDTCGKNYPTLKKLKSLFSQLYEYAMKNDICSKDYSEFVDIVKYKDKNPDKRDHNKFTKEEIERLWTLAEDPHYQIVLMLIYNGCRISEFLDLKKEDVHLDEQYFDVIASKTENGLRKVPIADKLLPFYKAWFDGSACEYLLHTPDQKHFDYRNYFDSYFTPLMEQLGFDHKPHDTRHTCISKLTEAHVDQTMIKKIVGHSGAMTLTERVYTHLDIEILVEAINKIT